MITSRLFRKALTNNFPAIHTTNSNYLFWEKDPKSGYGSKTKYGPIKSVSEGFKILKKECKLFIQEVKEHFKSDIVINFNPGVVDKLWSFKSDDDLNLWISTCDSDHGQGFSTCKLSINNKGGGLFSGTLCTDAPKDGAIKRAGYCSVRTLRTRKSFKREAYMDWTQYTHLVLRVRGDGRSYMLNIATCGYFDQLWNDVYHYILFTRGGPYWQTVKIPFSKFIFASKGRIQDKQSPISLDSVSHFGITASDQVNGPFSLEIDYIGLEMIPDEDEEFAYEVYRTPKNIAAN